MRKTALTLALLALLLGACQAAIETPAPDRKTPLPGPYDPQMLTPVSEATLPPVDGAAGAMFPEGVYNAQIDLAGQLGITAGEVQVLRLSGQEWPDGCLGLGGPEEACAAEVTPGYLVTLLANGRLYEYRINEDGSQVRAATAIDAAAQTAVQQARWLMVDALGGEDSSYQVVDVQPVEWADSCLGLPVSTDQICEAVTMPGYRILLSANDTLYEVHTNTDGTQSAIAGSDSVPVGQIFLRLTTSENPDVCREILAGTGGVISGACDGGLRAAAFGGGDLPAQLSDLAALFAPFDADTVYGSLIFTGLGSQEASPAQQRAIAAWVRLAAAQTGDEEALTPEVLLTWERSGGIAGVCETLQINLAGWAELRTCAGALSGRVLLTGEQLESLYNWVDQYAPQSLTRSEDAADGFQYTLTVSGQGAETPDETIQNDWFTFTENLRASFP
jgi:hypothetical protein